MTKLSDTQLVILSAAAQRAEGAVLPLPETLTIKGGAVDKVLGSLKSKGLIDHQGAPRGDDPPLRITRAGLAAIGVETEDDASEGTTPADTGATSADAGVQAIDAAPAKRGKAAKRKAKATKPGKSALAEKPTPRAGTKQAQMIEMLKRPEGATVEQIAEATGWQHHTIRGAISGALKKEARAHGRGHAHARGRPQQERRQGERHDLSDRRLNRPDHLPRAAAEAPCPAAHSSSRWTAKLDPAV